MGFIDQKKKYRIPLGLSFKWFNPQIPLLSKKWVMLLMVLPGNMVFVQVLTVPADMSYELLRPAERDQRRRMRTAVLMLAQRQEAVFM